MSDANMNDKSATALRDLLAERVVLNWEQFAREHPSLAASIDRVELIESVVTRLADDPQYQRAMELAGRDELELAASAEVLAAVDAWVRKALILTL